MRLLLLLTGLVNLGPSLAIPYDNYILAPKSRTLYPVSVHSTNGSVSHPESLTSPSGNTVFDGDSATSYDFGINIAGIVTLTIGNVSSTDQYVGVTFSESSLWVSNASSDATAEVGRDETIWFQVTGPGKYAAPREKERGGFRYMTLVHNTTGTMEITTAEIHYTPMPHWADDALGAYTGYFHSDDELLNRIWYAGAYTNQMCTINPNNGDSVIHIGATQYSMSDVNVTWYNNQTITDGTSALVDGAKRDRLVWAGDMAIAVPGIVVSTNDVISIQNSLNSLFDLQDGNSGQLPYAGKPFPMTLSYTYHLYTLIGVADHFPLYQQGDTGYLQSLWPKWKLGLGFSISHIDETGLMDVTSTNDWLRFGMGGHNIEANAILYATINQGIALATALNDTDPISQWQATADRLKTAANNLLWDANAGMYKDNETATLNPQDGNSWAIVANLTLNDTQSSSISQALRNRWTPYGAPALEAADAISPFISGFELQAHFLAGNADAALALMRLEWGYMLNDPRMTNSTFIEGYASNGDLHYAPYAEDARISHAHGWATGPTSSLTFYVAGIHLLSAGGKTWRIAPMIGDLRLVDAGFRTSVGDFSAKTTVENGMVEVQFQTPEGTTGDLEMPNVPCEAKKVMMKKGQGKWKEAATVVKDVGERERVVGVQGIAGGNWVARIACQA